MAGLDAALEAPSSRSRARFDVERQGLVGGQCDQCGAQTWPKRAVCHRCGSAAIEDVVLPREGVLTTWSRVWVPVDGIEPPYDVGLVRIGAVTLFTHVRGVSDEHTVPVDVVVHVDEGHRPPFWVSVLEQR